MVARNTLKCSLVSFAMLATVAAAQGQITPANLGDPTASRYLVRHIEFPETDGDAAVTLECQSIISAAGKMRDAGCYIKNNWEPDFAEAVRKASKKALLIPAKSGKKGQKIALMFLVEFLKKADEKTIKIYLNPGEPEMVAEYGPEHISAQRVIGSERWRSICPKHAEWTIIAKAHVNEGGIASSVDLEHGAGISPTGPCQQAIIDTILSSQFAPATVDAEPVPGSYTEPFGN